MTSVVVLEECSRPRESYREDQLTYKSSSLSFDFKSVQTSACVVTCFIDKLCDNVVLGY